MALTYKKTADYIGMWMANEKDYPIREDKNVFHSGDAHRVVARLGTLMDYEVPDTWTKFRSLRGEGRMLLASQQILRVCAVARTASVLNKMADAKKFERAKREVYEEYENSSITEGGNYILAEQVAKLDRMYSLAAGPTEPYMLKNRNQTVPEVFHNVVQLAVAHLLDVAEDGKLVLPAPNQPEGMVTEWNINP